MENMRVLLDSIDFGEARKKAPLQAAIFSEAIISKEKKLDVIDRHIAFLSSSTPPIPNKKIRAKDALAEFLKNRKTSSPPIISSPASTSQDSKERNKKKKKKSEILAKEIIGSKGAETDVDDPLLSKAEEVAEEVLANLLTRQNFSGKPVEPFLCLHSAPSITTLAQSSTPTVVSKAGFVVKLMANKEDNKKTTSPSIRTPSKKNPIYSGRFATIDDLLYLSDDLQLCNQEVNKNKDEDNVSCDYDIIPEFSHSSHIRNLNGAEDKISSQFNRTSQASVKNLFDDSGAVDKTLSGMFDKETQQLLNSISSVRNVQTLKRPASDMNNTSSSAPSSISQSTAFVSNKRAATDESLYLDSKPLQASAQLVLAPPQSPSPPRGSSHNPSPPMVSCIASENSVKAKPASFASENSVKAKPTSFAPENSVKAKPTSFAPENSVKAKPASCASENSVKAKQTSFTSAKDQFISDGGVFKQKPPPPKTNSGTPMKSRGSDNEKPSKEHLPPELQQYDANLVDKIQREILEDNERRPVTFDDIAGLEFAKRCVQEIICWPMLRPDLFQGLRALPKGLLLFGPPGTGKTLIGKAIAHQTGATFFSISASSLTSKWVGESESLVRVLFAVATYHQPSVVFIDEVDSLLTQRSSEESESSRRIKTEFLVQLDGTNGVGSGDSRVVVIGATNRPEELDEAARRRFAKRLYIPLPNEVGRRRLISRLLGDIVHGLTGAEMERVVSETEGFSGADIKNLCTEASLGPVRDLAARNACFMEIQASDVPPITMRHFIEALDSVGASVSTSDLDRYIEWNKSFGTYRRME